MFRAAKPHCSQGLPRDLCDLNRHQSVRSLAPPLTELTVAIVTTKDKYTAWIDYSDNFGDMLPHFLEVASNSTIHVVYCYVIVDYVYMSV